jgi:hypothetical protein
MTMKQAYKALKKFYKIHSQHSESIVSSLFSLGVEKEDKISNENDNDHISFPISDEVLAKLSVVVSELKVQKDSEQIITSKRPLDSNEIIQNTSSFQINYNSNKKIKIKTESHEIVGITAVKIEKESKKKEKKTKKNIVTQL